MATTAPDTELKARHRKMWASGDYPSMVETFLLPLGPRLVAACGVGPGMKVLDVAAGTGNASLPAAAAGAEVIASDLTPELLAVGRARAEAAGLGGIAWWEADAEHLPFADASFDVAMSCIGAMFAPHHEDVADELVRVCRPGGTIGLLSWTPEGMVGELFRTLKPFAPPPPPGAQPPPLWGSEEHLASLLGDRVEVREQGRDVLEVTAFAHPRDFAAHFRASYGRRSSPAPTRSATGGRGSSTPRSTRSPTRGTAGRPTPPASRWSTCSRSRHGAGDAHQRRVYVTRRSSAHAPGVVASCQRPVKRSGYSVAA